MGDLILSAALFTGEPVEEFIVLNEEEVAAQGVAPSGAYFKILPVDGDLDVEYTKKRGMDEQEIRFRPKKAETDGTGANVEFEPMSRTFSNQREIAANKWLCDKIVKGWRAITLDNGTELPFSGHNLAVLASIPRYARPIIKRAYELNELKVALSEGNSAT